MTEILNKEFSRTTFLKGGGALVVGFSLAGAAAAGKASAASGTATPEGYNPSLTRLDSWLRINEDNTVNVLTSQGDPGNGISTGFLMVAAEELDVEMSQMINGTSAFSKGMQLNTENDGWVVGQTGGIGGSNSMSSTGHRIRAAAVAARAELLKLASTKLGVPVASLTVAKGVVSGGGKSTTYGELVGGKLFSVNLTTTSLQHGVSPAKPVSDYKLVGTKAPRVDIPAKVNGRFTYTHNVKLPGMLHARWIRPGQGPWLTDGFAKPLSVDEGSIKHLPDVKLVRKGDFLAVVGPVEYQVVQAAAQLKVKWAETPILPGHANLWSSFRKADSAGLMPARITNTAGNFDTAFKAATKTVSGSFSYAYNGHNPIGPACAVADYKALGGVDKDQVTVIFNTQNISSTTADVQQLLGLTRPNQVRMIYYEGSSTYGNGYHYLDISGSAALISKLAGAPVRLQLMRWDEQGWTRYGPAIMHDIRAGIDDKGNILAYEATAFAQASTNVSRRRASSPTARCRRLRAPAARTPRTWRRCTSSPRPRRSSPTRATGSSRRRRRSRWACSRTERCARRQARRRRSPRSRSSTCCRSRRTSIRSRSASRTWRRARQALAPNGSATRACSTAAVDAAKAAGYVPRVSGSKLEKGNVVSGWGMAVGTHNDSYAATVAHVTVDKKSGKVTVNHLFAGQDSGFIINPDLIMNQMTGSLIQSTSKLLHEELQFDRKRVTSRDWVSYPILRFKDTPKVTPVIVFRPDREASGSGEPPLLSASAAIPNAIFDATGVRMTQAPLTPVRVRGFLSAAGK